MAYCINCGKELNKCARFCDGCGAKVASKAEEASERKTVFEGEIHKCPNCGDIIDAYETVCEACGYEIRGRKITSVVHELALKLENTDDVEKKEELIRTFYIPNTKEDIYEFMILASSNIDLNNADMNAWIIKVEQVYQKAKLVFLNSSDFAYIEETYKKATKGIVEKKAIKTIANVAKKSELAQIFLYIAGMMLLIFVSFGLLMLLGVE